MESRKEIMFSQLYDRRKDFLRDMDIEQLIELFPTEDDVKEQLRQEKELMIEVIIENVWDKQINDEVK